MLPGIVLNYADDDPSVSMKSIEIRIIGIWNIDPYMVT